MALSTITQPPFRVDTIAELNFYLSTFIINCPIFCVEDSRWYIKKVGNIISLIGEQYSLALTPPTLPILSGVPINDYNPAGLSTVNVLRLSTSGTHKTITGIVAPAYPKTIMLININTTNDNIILSGSDILSASTNRFMHSGNITISKGRAAYIWYDFIAANWIAFATV